MKQETYTIFYSWQSDNENKSRNLIESALKDASEQIMRDYHIKIIIDHSTLGEAGSPDITQVIMEKIDHCDMFVCDLTPIVNYVVNGNDGPRKKEVPNSNVLLEMGYAMSALGVNYIIPLCHQGTYDVNNLPFDINHHAIATFNSGNINLVSPIIEVIKHIHKYGPHRQITEPYVVSTLKNIVSKIAQKWRPKYDKEAQTIYYESTVFFKMRMCDAFPGKRGLIEYSKVSDIKESLKQLLKYPIKFDHKASDREVTDPIWWFSDGSALSVDDFEHIEGRRFRFGTDEYKIRRIIAYIDNGRYYSNYVYIEIIPDQPVSVYSKPSEEKLNEYIKEHKEYVQEYAEYKVCSLLTKKITRHEYDDGNLRWWGKTIYLNGKAQLRSRTLTPFSFIITAKFSPYNCREFDRTSGEMFYQLREGIITKEEFNKYMLNFPKHMYDI